MPGSIRQGKPEGKDDSRPQRGRHENLVRSLCFSRFEGYNGTVPPTLFPALSRSEHHGTNRPHPAPSQPLRRRRTVCLPPCRSAGGNPQQRTRGGIHLRPFRMSAAGRRADAYRRTPRRIEVHQDALVSYPGRAGAQARQLRSGYQPRQDVESGHDARGRRPAENLLGAFREGMVRRFFPLVQAPAPSPAALQLADPDHRQPPVPQRLPDHLRVRRGAPLDAKGVSRHPRAGGHLQSAGSFPLHAADARAEAAFAHRAEHRQQSCRHRYRDQQFRAQGHGDPYPFRGDASRECAPVHRRGPGFRALPAACEKARRGRAYPFSRQGGGHARVVPGNGSVCPAFVL